MLEISCKLKLCLLFTSSSFGRVVADNSFWVISLNVVVFCLAWCEHATCGFGGGNEQPATYQHFLKHPNQNNNYLTLIFLLSVPKPQVDIVLSLISIAPVIFMWVSKQPNKKLAEESIACCLTSGCVHFHHPHWVEET